MRAAKQYLLVTVTLFWLAGACGCVRRIVSINSQPEEVEVYFDRKLVGKTPCEFEFLYYGTHHLELVKKDYANLNTQLTLKGPFYEYFPLSFFSELLIPWEITDAHNYIFELQTGQSKEPVITPIKQPQPSLGAPELERIERNE